MRSTHYSEFKKAWCKRIKQEEKALQKRQSLLFKRVRKCALELKKIGAKRIILFGSFATGRFRKDSDVDIAVEGLSAKAYFKALGIVEEILDDIPFDLIDLREALPSVAERIKKEGIIID